MLLMVVLSADSNWTSNVSDLGCRRRRVSSCKPVLLLGCSRAIMVDEHLLWIDWIEADISWFASG